MTLNSVNVHMHMTSHDRSINASRYLNFVCHDMDRDILVMLDDWGIVLRFPVGGFFFPSPGSSVRFEAMAPRVFFLQSLLCLAVALQFSRIDRFGGILTWSCEIMIFQSIVLLNLRPPRNLEDQNFMSGFTSPGTRFVWLFYWGLSVLADPAVSYTTASRVLSFKRFFSIPKRPDWLWLSPSFLVSGCLGHLLGIKRPGHEADHLHLFPRLRMSKISTSTPSYTYMTPQSVQLGR
jgi:hypothetical protein